MDEAERAREYQPFTRPPRMNRFATAIWQAQARRYRRRAQRSSADENRAQMREIAPAERSIHQLKAMWSIAYEAVDSSASSQEK